MAALVHRRHVQRWKAAKKQVFRCRVWRYFGVLEGLRCLVFQGALGVLGTAVGGFRVLV